MIISEHKTALNDGNTVSEEQEPTIK